MKVVKVKINSLEDLLNIMSQDFSKYLCEEPIKEEEEVNLEYFISKIAEKKGWKLEKANGWLKSIADINTSAAFSIILKEIAVWLDHKYEDHIENSEKIFIISTFDGRIHEICKAHIKNYRNFAAFRTIEDARFACNILKHWLKGMFKTNVKE